MPVNSDAADDFVQRFSIAKTVATEILLVAGAILPLTPKFSEGLVYTAFLYRMPFKIFLYGVCITLGLMALAFGPFLWWAVNQVPALKITKNTITVHRFRDRIMNTADVVGIQSVWPGANVLIQSRQGKPLALPVFLYKQSNATRERLRRLLSHSATI